MGLDELCGGSTVPGVLPGEVIVGTVISESASDKKYCQATSILGQIAMTAVARKQTGNQGSNFGCPTGKTVAPTNRLSETLILHRYLIT